MRLAAALAAVLIANAAQGADLTPSRGAIAKAARTGAAQAELRHGYPLKSHVLYEVRDARAADPADGDVDAVVVATPLERTRHAAYAAAYVGRKITPVQAYAEAGLRKGQFAIIVFAHGQDDDDEAFAAGFSQAVFSVEGREPLTAVPLASETTEAVYPLAQRNRARQVATITYRFDVGRAGAGRLSFTDPTGKAFELDLDLARFE